MQDAAEALEILATEPHGDLLGERVAHRIWMTEPLALDDLDLPRSRRCTLTQAGDDIQSIPQTCDQRVPAR
jgi:hypothetical protein